MIIRVWWSLIRFGFRLLYNDFAWAYDVVSWAVSLGQWRQWQRVVFKHIADIDGVILELAHGTANLQIDMVKRSYRSVAIDLSPAMSRIAHNKLIKQGMMPQLARASAMRLPFANESLSTIVATFPTEFIFQPETTGEVVRVLAPSGQLVVVLNGMLTVTNPLVWLLERLYRITGQRGPLPENVFQSFHTVGLDTQLFVEKLNGSVAWILVATKSQGMSNHD